MKYIPRHNQSVEIEFSENKVVLFRATFPFKKRSFNLSQWYKKAKEAVASSEKIPVWKLTGKHKIIDSKLYDRILFEWAGGIAIDIPDNATEYDYKIILHYLEGLKMSCNQQEPS